MSDDLNISNNNSNQNQNINDNSTDNNQYDVYPDNSQSDDMTRQSNKRTYTDSQQNNHHTDTDVGGSDTTSTNTNITTNSTVMHSNNTLNTINEDTADANHTTSTTSSIRSPPTSSISNSTPSHPSLNRKLSNYHQHHASQNSAISPRSDGSSAPPTHVDDMDYTELSDDLEQSTALIIPPPPSTLNRDESIATQYALSHDTFGTLLYCGTGLYGLSADSNIDEAYNTTSNVHQSDLSDNDTVDITPLHSETNVHELARIPFFKTIDIRQVSYGSSHAVALTSTGQVYSWGSNNNGQLGIGNKSDTIQYQPQLITTFQDKFIRCVVAGYNQTAFITLQNELYMCGCNANGQLGLNSSKVKSSEWSYDDAVVPTLVKPLQKVNVMSVALGDRHSIVLSDLGTVFVCGDASTGALGLPEKTKWTVEQPNIACFSAIATLSPSVVVDIAAGETHTVVLLNTGAVYSFGTNKRGQLGVGDNKTQYIPKHIDALNDIHVVRVYCGTSHSMFLTSTGELYACGDGRSGQLGLGNNETYYLPQQIDTLNDHIVLNLACGYNHTIVVTNDNLVFTFGSNDSNQCSTIQPNELSTPTLLHHTRINNRPIFYIAAGSDTTAIVTGNPIKQHNDNDIQLQMPCIPVKIPKFDGELFSRMLSTANVNNDYMAVYSYIHKIFSVPQYINNSFLSSDLTQLYGGINADCVESAYKQILNESVRQPKLYQVLASSVQKLVTTMTDRLKSDSLILDQSAFRCLCIVLQCPIMMSNSPSDIALTSDLCIVLRRTNAAFKQTLKSWFATYTPLLFQTRLVRMLIQFLQRRLSQLVESSPQHHPLQRVTEEIVSAVELLSILKAASKLHTPALAAEQLFHIDKIEQYIDMQNDFILWLNSGTTAQNKPIAFTFCRYSFLLTPLTKSALLRMESSYSQQQSAFYSYILGQQPSTVFKIRRHAVLDDTIAAINSYTQDDLRRPLEIQFISADGVAEDGLDRGGLSREYFELIARDIVKPDYALFDYNNEQRTLWYNLDEPDYSKSDLYYIAGLVFGLALYNGIQCSVNFVTTIYRQLLNLPLSLDNLEAFDSTLAKSLKDMQSMTDEEIDSLCLTFAVTAPNHKHNNNDVKPVIDRPASHITEIEHDPTTQQLEDNIHTVELILNGTDIPVTKSNLQEYIDKYIQYILHDSVKIQSQQFLRGFRSVCNGKAIKLFTSKDLEQIITGGNSNLNFDDLQAATRYEGYTSESPIIKQFWNIFMNRLTADQRREFLVFATGSARSPLGGLKQLRLIIQRAGPDTDQLPTGHTCFDTNTEVLIHINDEINGWMDVNTVLQYWGNPAYRNSMRVASLQRSATYRVTPGDNDTMIYSPLVNVVRPFVYSTRYNQPPIRIRCYTSHCGAVDLLLTPDHNMYVSALSNSKHNKHSEQVPTTLWYPYQYVQAQQLLSAPPEQHIEPSHFKGWRIKTSAPITSVDYEFTLPSLHELLLVAQQRNTHIDIPLCHRINSQHPIYAAHTFTGSDMDAWISFVGFHCAGGSIHTGDCNQSYVLHYTQKSHSEFISNTFDLLQNVKRSDGSKLIPVAWHRRWVTQHNWWEYYWTAVQVITYLLVLQLHSIKQKKYIALPHWVWLLSSRQARIFLSGMAHVDGTQNNKQQYCTYCDKQHNGFRNITTSSKQHADEIHRLAMHAGYDSHMVLYNQADTVNDKTGSHPGSYAVTIHRRDNDDVYVCTRPAHQTRGEPTDYVVYDTSVEVRSKQFWCVSTENESHIVLVRRRVDDYTMDDMPNQRAIKSLHELCNLTGDMWMTGYVGNCFNLLLLPEYSSEDKLYDKLTLALKYGQTGFGLQ